VLLQIRQKIHHKVLGSPETFFQKGFWWVQGNALRTSKKQKCP
jgi:hypothetical protein